MRHLRSNKKLGRETSHRNAMLRNLATSFLREGRIKTTVSRAKALRPVVEKLITTGKSGTLHDIRKLNSYVYSKDVISKVVKDLGMRFKERNGGYTRIIKVGNRLGDNAPICFLELVDFHQIEGKSKKEARTKVLADKATKKEEEQKMSLQNPAL
jgi:large subunit ribosomal protein L17